MSQKPENIKMKDLAQLSCDFNAFLKITSKDKQLLESYRTVLSKGAAKFAEVFYDYLFDFKPTAQLLERYVNDGGDIQNLAKSQMDHLLRFLHANTDTKHAEELIKIGRVHYFREIKPVWIMGAYHLYLEFLESKIDADSNGIKEHDKKPLKTSITKFLYRDIGLMLEGYWDTAITVLDKERHKVSELQEQVSSLLANLPQVLWSVDVTNNKPLYISPSTQDICPIKAEMPIPYLGWTIPQDRERVKDAWQKAMQGEMTAIETRVIAPGKEPKWFKREFHPYKDSSGKVIRIDGVMEDITESKHAIKRLEHLATTDTLTGLANRTLWYDRLSQAIVSARRDGGRQVVLMLLDLNHFKIINDTLGHPAGDDLLKHVAKRMCTAIRDTDTLARLGGDEFSIILPNVDDPKKACDKVANKVLDCFKEPFSVHGNDDIYLGASIGVVIYPDHGDNTDSLVSRADIAMYSAKRGDLGYLFYDPGSDTKTSDQLQLSSLLRRSMERDELSLNFQPKIEIHNGQVCGVEALLRWKRPGKGFIEPTRFIPIAEQNGMIAPITDWVLKTALKQCCQWKNNGLSPSVAVNVSARLFQNPKLVSKIKNAIDYAEVEGSCLEIEITEDLLMTDLERGADMIRQLNQLGVSIAIDDFGTGYSSLAYLKKLPINTIKIDKSFIMDMTHDDNCSSIVQSIIDLGHNLGMKVIAEGVENTNTLYMLSMFGCDAVQGFHISRPTDGHQMSNWLSNNPWEKPPH